MKKYMLGMGMLCAASLAAAQTPKADQAMDTKRQHIAAVAALTGRGDLAGLESALAAGLDDGMTSAQVALGWLLQKEPWIVPIPGTTKLSHLEENLRTLDFNLAAEEWRALETAVAAIPVVGDRYNAEQQRQVGR